MAPLIRPANLSDLDMIIALLSADAEERCSADPGLWRLAEDAHARIRSAIETAMTTEKPRFRQRWIVAENEERQLSGVIHSILLPVPPIYAGEFGAPGLIMEGSHVASDAPPGTRSLLLEAAETDLMEAGARFLLASGVTDGAWEADYTRRGYEPLTAYLAKTGLTKPVSGQTVRAAVDTDVPGIVAASAVHRKILERLHGRFWKPHPDADARFGAWMRCSLTLADRDMFVAEDEDIIRGYAISQPATELHFPAAHDIAGIGVIDDFFDASLSDTLVDDRPLPIAESLLLAAEAARARRGDHSVLVVCPARWRSKIDLLKRLGYRIAITWYIRIVD